MSVKFNQLSNAIRFLSVDAVQKANSGHPGMPMGMADVATVLFKYHLRFNPKNPNWINRDRFIYLQVMAQCFFTPYSTFVVIKVFQFKI